MLANTQPAHLLKRTPLKSTFRITDGSPFLLDSGRTFHTEPREWPSQHSLEWTTYSTHCHLAVLPLKTICVNWKGSDQTFNRGESGWNREGIQLLQRVFYNHTELWNLCRNICHNTTNNNRWNFPKDFLLDFCALRKSHLFSSHSSLIKTTTWQFKASVARHSTIFAWPTACMNIQDCF